MPIPAIIALGVMAAAALAGSQMSAAEEEKIAKRRAQKQKLLSQNDALLEYWQQRANEAGQQSGFANANNAGGALRNRGVREADYTMARQDAADRADMTRTNGYLQAGAAIAGGIANGAFGGLGAAAPSTMGGLTADQMANAAGEYALNEGASRLLSSQAPMQQQPLSFDDGQGGWQLPESLRGDYTQTPDYQRRLRLYGP